LEGLGGILRNDVAAKSGLNEFELIEGQAGDAAMVGVLNLVALAKGGAQDADRIGPVSLDFEMDASVGLQDGYYIPISVMLCQASIRHMYGYM
jgi:hypothetical protein